MSSSDHLSKSAVKREMLALQALGEQLTKLSSTQRERIVMPDNLREALNQAASMKSREARRRQLQYIGKLMRQVDTEPLRAALDTGTARQRQQTEALHALESLRDRLISEGNPAIEKLLHQWPTADRSRLRQLVRAAREKPATGDRSTRKLFRYLATLQAEQPDSAATSADDET